MGNENLERIAMKQEEIRGSSVVPYFQELAENRDTFFTYYFKKTYVYYRVEWHYL